MSFLVYGMNGAMLPTARNSVLVHVDDLGNVAVIDPP